MIPTGTHDIRVGDRIAVYDMKLRIDRELVQSQLPVGNVGGIVGLTLATAAIIENWDELKRRSDAGDSTARHLVDGARLHADGTARWVVRGNGHTLWNRITD